MSARWRRLVLVLASVAVVGAACQPPKPPPPPPPGQLVASYLTLFEDMGGTGGSRASTPAAFSLPGGGTAAQALAPDGSVALGIEGATTSTANGFLTYPFPLGDLQSVQLELADPAQVSIWLLLDRNGDSDFFQWNASDELTGDGGDRFASSPDTTTDGGTTAALGNATDLGVCPLGPCLIAMPVTLPEIKAGVVDGIDADTLTAIAVSLIVPEEMVPVDAHTLVTSLRVNGIELLVP